MRKEFWKTRPFWYIVLGVIAALIILSLISGWIVHWLWMGQLGYIQIFFRLLSLKLILFGIVFVVVFLYFWINLDLSIKYSLRAISAQLESLTSSQVSPRGLRIALTVISGFIALIFGLIWYPHWETYMRFHWGGSFGMPDPLYNLDIGFYVFRLPFYELIQNTLLGMTLIAFLGVLLVYLYAGGTQFGQTETPRMSWRFNKHLSILFIFALAAWAWGYYLDRFELLYSTRGVVYGAGYTDYHIFRLGLWVMLFGSLAFGGLLLVNVFVKRTRVIYIGAGSYVGLILVILVLLPGIFQNFKVQPNELELETPFLNHNIEFTRNAYQLDRIQEREYPAVADLTPKDIARNETTLRNIRLWDWRPIRQTFRQTQEIRLYYKFYEVDVDRYHLENGDYRQVMLSARELAERLPAQAQTWVNQYLQYTHGYGLAMSLVSEKVEEGLPEYLVKDLPPVTKGLAVDQPAVYYGEKMPGYRIVNTKVKEFDYPRGDKNVYTRYDGNGGIPIDSIFKKLLFAWDLGDISILLSDYITPESRIQLWREVQDRVRKIAPFLILDEDPYLVVSEGKLYWIQDAYTTSSKFPYAEPFRRGLNYIRNSVKIIVDVYHGTVTFYTMDPDDPILGVYRAAFPEVFQELQEMPQDLKTHLRYPLDLFQIQVDKFRLYHMTIPQVFYNREDLWTLPREKYAGSPIDMEPYYILIRLPDEQSLQYLIMIPLTPDNRDNMIAWMAAKADFPDYGQVIAYKLPKERLTYGPLQIEAMIDQDDVISQQLSLWDQRGSRVIRGNLLVIPLDRSFIYVEPVYLIAEQTDIPQLKRVIVVYGKKVVMQPTLKQALQTALGAPEALAEKKPAAAPGPPRVQEALREKVKSQLEKAESALQDGRWISFGKAMDELKTLLQEQSESQ